MAIKLPTGSQKKEEKRRAVKSCTLTGSFHIVVVFLAVIWKRFGESGLEDLLLESTIVGSSLLKGVLDRKHYNMAVYTDKVIY